MAELESSLTDIGWLNQKLTLGGVKSGFGGMAESENICANNANFVSSNTFTVDPLQETPKRKRDLILTKPILSYANLIVMALESTPDIKMTLSDIYKWIVENYPYYKHTSIGWKNSIRHNLSLNKCFVRLSRSREDPGKGSYWTIDRRFLDETGPLKMKTKHKSNSERSSPYTPTSTPISPNPNFGFASLQQNGNATVEAEPSITFSNVLSNFSDSALDGLKDLIEDSIEKMESENELEQQRLLQQQQQQHQHQQQLQQHQQQLQQHQQQRIPTTQHHYSLVFDSNDNLIDHKEFIVYNSTPQQQNEATDNLNYYFEETFDSVGRLDEPQNIQQPFGSPTKRMHWDKLMLNNDLNDSFKLLYEIEFQNNNEDSLLSSNHIRNYNQLKNCIKKAGNTNWKDVDLTDYPDLAENLECADINNWNLDSDQLLDLAASLSEFFSINAKADHTHNPEKSPKRNKPHSNIDTDTKHEGAHRRDRQLVIHKRFRDLHDQMLSSRYDDDSVSLSSADTQSRDNGINRKSGKHDLHVSPGNHFLPSNSQFIDKMATETPTNSTTFTTLADDIEDDFNWESIIET